MDTSSPPPVVDAHLDLAFNALLNGRDLTRTVDEIRATELRDREQSMVSLPDLSRAGVAVVCATLFVEPATVWSAAYMNNMTAKTRSRVYSTPQEAEKLALEQLELYQRWQDDGHARIITNKATLEEHLRRWPTDLKLGLIVLMESADPIVEPDNLERWHRRGLRMISLAWGQSRYAGGTGSTGGLSAEGRELLQGMRELGIVHDVSHLAEEAFWEGLEVGHHALCATHSNARNLLPTPQGESPNLPPNRHLSDAMIDAIGRENGVIGVNLINAFLDARWRIGQPAGTNPAVHLGQQARAQTEYLAGRIGWDKVGVGSDIDAGAGGEETPQDLQRASDYPNLARLAPESHQEAVLGGNWLRFFARALP